MCVAFTVNKSTRGLASCQWTGIVVTEPIIVQEAAEKWDGAHS